MSNQSDGTSTDKLDFDFNFGGSGVKSARSTEQRSAVVILGDFCGRNKADKLTPQCKVVAIDTIDDVLASWQPQCEVTLPANLQTDDGNVLKQTLTLKSADDLHPDQLIQSIDWLRSLYSIWRNLDAPEQRAAALEALSQWQPVATPSSAPPQSAVEPAASAASPANTAADESANDALDRLLGKSVATQSTSSSAQRSASSRLQSLVQQAVASATTDAPDAQIKAAKEQCAELLARALQATLQDPGLRAVNRAWESADWLLRRLDDKSCTVTLVNLPERQLYAQLADAGSDGLASSPLQPLLERATEGVDNCVIVGLYSFGDDIAELTAAAQLAALAGRQGGAFTAHGELTLAGCSDASMLEQPEQWQAPNSDALTFWSELQNHAVARHLFLATPQFILRQPFGEQSDPIETFPFEELSRPPAAEEFCWGNPALPSALALITGDRTFPDIPQPTFMEGTGNDRGLQLPIESRVSDRAAAALQSAGLHALRYNPTTGQVVL